MNNMETLLFVLAAILYLGLILVAAVRPAHEKDHYRADFISIQQILTALLVVFSTATIILAVGWLWGLLIELIVVIFYGSIGRLRLVARWSESIYQKIDRPLVKFIDKHPVLFRVVRTTSSVVPKYHLDSVQELESLINENDNILTANQQRVILNSLRFDEKAVGEVMTPRSQISSIDADEFLGPLVLDEIHGSGHSRLPVLGDGIDDVVGILYVNDLLSLDNKHSATAGELMDPKVFYINENDSLQHALAAFIKTHHQMFIVINAERETVGLLTLEDVIERLLGQKIIDEDDDHRDPRKIAAQTNNRSANHKDV